MKNLILFLFIISSFSCTVNQKYIGIIQDGMKCMEESNWQQGIAQFKISLNVDSINPNVYYKLGECYFRLGNDKEAIKYFNKALELGKSSNRYDKYDAITRRFSPEINLLLGQSLARNGETIKAKNILEDFKQSLPENHRAVTEINYELSAIKTAESNLSNPKNYSIAPIFSGYFAPTPAIDGSIMYLSKFINDTPISFVTYRNIDGTWTEPIKVDSTNAGYPAFSNFDCTTIAYISSGKLRYDPFVKTDRALRYENILYYTKNEKDGDRNIWTYNYLNNEHKELTKINSKYDELPVSISEDGKTLYISSNRRGTMGMHDIFQVDLKTGNATNMGYPINSTKDEWYFSLSGSGIAYMCSDRTGELQILKVSGLKEENIYIYRGYVKVFGSEIEDTITVYGPAGFVRKTIGEFLIKVPKCGSFKLTYEIGNELAGTEEIIMTCNPGYNDVSKETYLFKRQPEPDPIIIEINSEQPESIKQPEVEVEEVIVQTETGTVIQQVITKLDPQPEWSYNANEPVNFIFSDTLGFSSFERYFTYNGLEFGKAEDKFTQFISSIAFMIESGSQVDIKVQSSASKVPTRKYGSNEVLAKDRAENAVDKIKKSLSAFGYVEDRDYKIVYEYSVNGKKYQNDAQKNKAEYEKNQYIRAFAIRR